METHEPPTTKKRTATNSGSSTSNDSSDSDTYDDEDLYGDKGSGDAATSTPSSTRRSSSSTAATTDTNSTDSTPTTTTPGAGQGDSTQTTPGSTDGALNTAQISTVIMGGTVVTPGTRTMKALVEVEDRSGNYKPVIKSYCLTAIWPINKYPDWKTKFGQKIRDGVRVHLGMQPKDFLNRWDAPVGPLRSDVLNELKSLRSYIVQQMKVECFGK